MRPDHRHTEPAPSSTAKLLVVDDDDIARDQLCRLLTAHQLDVTSLASGIEALARLRVESFDVILMDLQMPHMNGVTTARLIRALPPPSGKVPIIAMSARLTDNEAHELESAGLNTFIQKPVDGDRLRSLLEPYVPRASQAAPKVAIPAQLYARFRDQARALLNDVEGSLSGLTARSETLQDSVHKMAGVANMFEQAELGEIAREIDRLLAANSEVPTSKLEQLRDELRSLLSNL